MDFIRDLQEWYMFGAPSLRKRDLREVADGSFMLLLAMVLLKKYTPYKQTVLDYAHRVTTLNSFDRFRPSSPVLYNYLWVINEVKSGEVKSMVRNYDRHINIINQASLPPRLVSWLRAVSRNSEDTEFTNQTLWQAERRFVITDSSYKSLRRLILAWDTLSKDDQKVAATRLKQALENKVDRSDEILTAYKKFLVEYNLGLYGVVNAETGEYEATRAEKIAAFGAGAIAGYALTKKILG